MLARLLFHVCLVSAGVMLVCMAILIVRRSWRERRLQREHDLARLVVRGQLQRLFQGAGAAAHEIPAASLRVRLDAMTQLLQLLRGIERNRLLTFAEEDGLFDDALRRLGSHRASRRADAIRTVEHFGSQKCVDALIRVMGTDPLVEIRLEAAASLARMGQLPPPDAVIDMLALRHQPLKRLHQALFRSLAIRDVDALARLLDEDWPEPLRAVIIDALGWGGTFSVLPALERAALDDSIDVRCATLRAARHLGHPASKRWILPMLQDESDVVRAQAARTCAALGLVEASQSLADLRQDASFWVRLRAEQALNVLAPALLHRQG